jgi:hypothetical protein
MHHDGTPTIVDSKKTHPHQKEKGAHDGEMFNPRVELPQAQKNLENFARRKYLEASKTASAFVDTLEAFSRTEGNMLKGYELTMLAALRASKIPLIYN